MHYNYRLVIWCLTIITIIKFYYNARTFGLFDKTTKRVAANFVSIVRGNLTEMIVPACTMSMSSARGFRVSTSTMDWKSAVHNNNENRADSGMLRAEFSSEQIHNIYNTDTRSSARGNPSRAIRLYRN